MSKGLFATLESLEDEVVVIDGDTVPESVMEVSEGSAELNEGAAEVDTLSAQIEDAAQADTEIAQIVDVAQDSVDAGTGLPPEAAQMAEIAVESICNRLGLRNQRIVPAMENFGSANSRVGATRIAIEGAMETIKNIWEGIKKFLKMVWTKISDFFMKFFSNTESLSKAAKELLEKASNLAGKVAKEKKFEDSSIANAFNKGGKVSKESVAEILDNHSAAVLGVNGMYEAAMATVSVINASVGKVKSEAGNGTSVAVAGAAGGDSSLYDAILKMMTAAKLSSNPTEKPSKDGKTVAKSHGPYVDGRYIVMSITSEDKKSVSGVSFTIDEDPKDLKKTEIPTMTPEEMTHICEVVVKLAKETGEYKKVQPTILKLGAELGKVVDGVLGAASILADKAENGAEARKHLASIKAAVSGMSTVVSRCAVMLPSMNVRAGNKALAYVSASIKQYKDKEVKK